MNRTTIRVSESGGLSYLRAVARHESKYRVMNLKFLTIALVCKFLRIEAPHVKELSRILPSKVQIFVIVLRRRREHLDGHLVSVALGLDLQICSQLSLMILCLHRLQGVTTNQTSAVRKKSSHFIFSLSRDPGAVWPSCESAFEACRNKRSWVRKRCTSWLKWLAWWFWIGEGSWRDS